MSNVGITSTNEFSFATQEIINLTSNHIIAHEALLREFNGLSIADFVRSPDLFITHSVETCQCIAEMQRELMIEQQVQVMFTNFSPMQICAPTFNDAMEMFYMNGITPSSLAIEVTEQTLPSDTQSFYQALDIIRAHGHPIIIDDFGAGMSNFTQVMRVRPSIVKTDMALIHAAEKSAYARRCLHALINYIQDIGAQVVIEGIENEVQRDIAEELGGNYGQGFFFGKPTLRKKILQDAPSKPIKKSVVKLNNVNLTRLHINSL